MKNNNKKAKMYDICIKWLEEIKLYRKESTIVKYKGQLDNHIIPFFGFYIIDHITNEDIITFINSLFKKGLAPKTISDIHTILKAILKYAVSRGYDVNFSPYCITVPQIPKKIRTLSVFEEKQLLEYIENNPTLTSLGILICLFTGIRIGELCALKWDDISLSRQELYVNKTMQRLKKLDDNEKVKTYICIDKPKSVHSIRTIPIPDCIMPQLISAYKDNSYVLTGNSNKYIEPRTMENRFKSIIKKCNISDANYHTLRHSYATRCIESGVDIKVLSEILGHSNVNITLNLYVHPSMNYKHENINKLSKYSEHIKDDNTPHIY